MLSSGIENIRIHSQSQSHGMQLVCLAKELKMYNKKTEDKKNVSFTSSILNSHMKAHPKHKHTRHTCI